MSHAHSNTVEIPSLQPQIIEGVQGVGVEYAQRHGILDPDEIPASVRNKAPLIKHSADTASYDGEGAMQDFALEQVMRGNASESDLPTPEEQQVARAAREAGRVVLRSGKIVEASDRPVEKPKPARHAAQEDWTNEREEWHAGVPRKSILESRGLAGASWRPSPAPEPKLVVRELSHAATVTSRPARTTNSHEFTNDTPNSSRDFFNRLFAKRDQERHEWLDEQTSGKHRKAKHAA